MAQEEFEALGVPFEKWGARFDDYVEGMRKIWSGEVVEHQSDFINWSGFRAIHFLSKTISVVMGGVQGKYSTESQSTATVGSRRRTQRRSQGISSRCKPLAMSMVAP